MFVEAIVTVSVALGAVGTLLGIFILYRSHLVARERFRVIEMIGDKRIPCDDRSALIRDIMELSHHDMVYDLFAFPVARSWSRGVKDFLQKHDKAVP